MAEELIKEWERFQLTENEEKVIGGEGIAEETEDTKAQIKLILVDKLWTVKPYNIDAMKRTLQSVWKLQEKVSIRVIETNLFVFQFYCHEDKEPVIEGCPWFFDEKLLLLKELQGDEQPSEITFTHTPMWVRLLDVPFNKRNVSVMYDVGEFLSGFIEFDDDDPLGWDEYVRMKILVDIRKPLRRGVFLATGSSSTKWVDMKYERLSDFCFFCGQLDHTDRECHTKRLPGMNQERLPFNMGLLRQRSISGNLEGVESGGNSNSRENDEEEVSPSFMEEDVEGGGGIVSDDISESEGVVGVTRSSGWHRRSGRVGQDCTMVGSQNETVNVSKKRVTRDEEGVGSMDAGGVGNKKQKMIDVHIAGDGVNRVEGSGLGHTLEEQ
uniref:CCHC-type domain-containing protein n=1 Tax=Chenopodium quinoa TaxID=63459 RepID=A0A803MIX6_CHEQI